MWEAGTPIWFGAQDLSRRCPPRQLPESTVSAPLISLREMINWIFLVSPGFGKSVTCLMRSWWCGEAQIILGLNCQPEEPGGQQEGSSGLPGHGPPGRRQMQEALHVAFTRTAAGRSDAPPHHLAPVPSARAGPGKGPHVVWFWCHKWDQHA